MEIKECSVDGCGSRVLAKGLCGKHYDRMRRLGTTELPTHEPAMCSECGERFAVYSSAGLCRPCYQKGRLNAQPRKGVCQFCGEEFTSKRRYSTESGRLMYCSRGCKEKARTASGKAAEAVRKSHYKTQYGLTFDEVKEMRARGCAICGSLGHEGRWGNLHVDHDHTTGVVRGALCHHCNVGLGHFKNDPALLLRAANYLTP